MEIEILVNAHSRHSGARTISLNPDDVVSFNRIPLYWHDGEIVEIKLKSGYTIYVKAANWNKYTESLLEDNNK